MFDSIVTLEERFLNEGREEGAAAGDAEGRREGKELGRLRGYEMGAEMGFYRGFCVVWLAIQKAETGGSRIRTQVEGLAALAAQVPRSNAPDHDMNILLESCRAKFRTISAMLKLDLAFHTRSQVAASDLSF